MTELEQDVLTRIAFGEEEPGDRALLADILAKHPSAQAELDHMRMLFGDMNFVATIPPAQISFDRVRQAIESAGTPVRKRSSFPFWGTMLGAAGLAACAAIVVMVTSRSAITQPTGQVAHNTVRETPPVAKPPVVADLAPNNGRDLMDDPDYAQTIEDLLTPGTVSTDSVSVADAAPKPNRHAVSHRPPARRPAPSRHRSTSDLNQPKLLSTVVREAPSAAPAAEATSKHPLVLVGERADPDTGAARATESTDSTVVEFRG